MKKLIITSAGVGVMRYTKPVERIPYVGKYAAIAELAVGSALAAGIFMKKATNPYIKSVAEILIIDGALKLIDKIPKVI